MSVVEQPVGPLWSASKILSAFLLIGSIATLGGLPFTLLFFYLTFLAIRAVFRMLLFSAKKSRDGVKHMAQLRRSERLKLSVTQAQSLVQVAPQITDARDYGEVHSMLSNIPGLKSNDLSGLKMLNKAEHHFLETVHQALRNDPSHSNYLKEINDAQQAASAFLKRLANTPALPAPELANGWLSFHEETRMSVQEIQNTLVALQQKVQATDALQNELQARVDNGETAAGPSSDSEVKAEPTLDAMLVTLEGKLENLPEDADPKTFQDLFELSQSIDAAFIVADRQPPSKLGLIPEEVRRVHQIEAFLSFYREKLDKLEAEKKDGKVDDSTYQTMRSSWERALESELSAYEAAD